MMQRSVWFLVACCGLLIGCAGVSSSSGTGGGSSNSGGGEAPVEGGGSEEGEGTGDDGSAGEGSSGGNEGEGTGSEGSGEEGGGEGGSGEETGGDTSGENGGSGTGGDGSNEGGGETTGGHGGGEGEGEVDPPQPDPETMDERFIRLGANFDRINTLFQDGTPYDVINLQDPSTTPSSGSIVYTGQLSLDTYTISPYLHGRMQGDAEISIATSSLIITGHADGFVGNFLKPGVSDLVAYTGTLSLQGGHNPTSTSADENVQLRVSGDLTHDIYTFELDGLLGGYFAGNGGSVFRADANNEVSGEPVETGDIAVKIYGNDASSTTAVLVLERDSGQ